MCKVVCAFNLDHSGHYRSSRGRLLLLLLPAKALGRDNLLLHFHHTSRALVGSTKFLRGLPGETRFSPLRFPNKHKLREATCYKK